MKEDQSGGHAWDFGTIVSIGLVRDRKDLEPRDDLSCEEFLRIWQENSGKLGGSSPDDLRGPVFDWLLENGLASPCDEETVRDICERARSSTPFLVAEFWIAYRWDYRQAVAVDDQGKLVDEVRGRLQRVLAALEGGAYDAHTSQAR